MRDLLKVPTQKPYQRRLEPMLSELEGNCPDVHLRLSCLTNCLLVKVCIKTLQGKDPHPLCVFSIMWLYMLCFCSCFRVLWKGSMKAW